MLYFIYAYSMSEADRLDIWPLRIAHAVVSYHEDAGHAHMCVNNMINNDFLGVFPDECWAVGAIPLGACHEHNLI